MNIKTGIVFLFFLFGVACYADDFIAFWNKNISTSIAGYNLYYGTNQNNYLFKTNTNNRTNAFLSGLSKTNTYFFTVTSYDNYGNESVHSQDSIYMQGMNKSNFIGTELYFGTNLLNLNDFKIYLFDVFSSNELFFSSSLIITNHPIYEQFLYDSNYYVYLGVQIKYGYSITSLNTLTYPIYTMTNPPIFQFYSSSLIITNKSF